MFNFSNKITNRRHGVEKFELDFDPEHTTPARVFRASLPWRAMVVCPENDRNLARIFLPRGPYRNLTLSFELGLGISNRNGFV